MSRNGAHPRPPLQPHLPALDGVRGLAILMVICFHVFLSNSMGYGRLSRAVGTALHYGIFGVDLFFALSGFLITGVLVDSLGDRGFFRKFYARRALRIFPLYYGVLLVLFAATPLLGLHWRGMGWLLLGYLQNLRPEEIGTYSPGHSIGLNHFWSLAVEEQFYLVWPALVFLGGQPPAAFSVGRYGSRRRPCVLRLALVWGGVGSQPIHVWTVTRADSLLLGGALALLYRSPAWGQAPAIGTCILSWLGRRGPGVYPAVATGVCLRTLYPDDAVVGGRAALHLPGPGILRPDRLGSDSPDRCLRVSSVGARCDSSDATATASMCCIWSRSARCWSGCARPIAQATHSKMLGVAGAGVLSIGGSGGPGVCLHSTSSKNPFFA